MDINEITIDSQNVSVKAHVVEVGEPRSVNTKFGPRQVADAVIEDKTGRINLTLWQEKIDEVKSSKEIEITNAYVREWNNILSLNLSKDSTIKCS
ncbi:MAG: DNA-binding protein [Candidatus Aenigmarchaeota archaeon ex4484_52]|nr:MAG: DNA-binding protein [Candidatus Aenigmarchaeota archaeon ex4484_52]